MEFNQSLDLSRSSGVARWSLINWRSTRADQEHSKPNSGDEAMKGTYCLVIEIPSDIVIGTTASGNLDFKKGYWLYIGSAQGTASTNLANRLDRHFRHEKKIHWHIDHLLTSHVNLVDTVWAESTGEYECKVAQYLEGKKEFIWGLKGFGSSDCKKSCKSHTLYFQGNGQPTKQLELAFRKLNLQPHKYSKMKPLTR
jgi:Uri superfamily endonuclease